MDSRAVAVIEHKDLPRLAAEITKHVDAANDHARGAVGAAIAAGQLLTRAKELVDHGQWNDWLLANVTVAPRTARAYVALAARHPMLPEPERQRVANLPLRQAMQAVATPAEAPTKSTRYAGPPREKRDVMKLELLNSASQVRSVAKLMNWGIIKSSDFDRARRKLAFALTLLDRIEQEHKQQEGPNHG